MRVAIFGRTGTKIPTKLYEAKLGEQRRFVLWWDDQEKQQGALKRGQAPASPVNDAGKRISDFGLDRDTIHRWRRRLKERKKYAEMLYGAVYAKAIASRPRDGVSRPHTAGSSRRPPRQG